MADDSVAGTLANPEVTKMAAAFIIGWRARAYGSQKPRAGKLRQIAVVNLHDESKRTVAVSCFVSCILFVLYFVFVCIL